MQLMNPLESVQIELSKALALRAELDQRRQENDLAITALQETIKLLEPVYGNRPSTASLKTLAGATADDFSNLGITAAIERALMMFADQWVAPTAVRDVLVHGGHKLAGDNPLASIHQILKRLVARKDSPFVSLDVNGQTLYKYSSPPHPINYFAFAQESAKKHAADVGRHRKNMNASSLPPLAESMTANLLEQEEKKK
jgi:hypothetical protein